MPERLSGPPTFPPSWRDLNHSQSDDILYRSRHYRRNITRNSSQSRAIYLRSFISTDSAPTPVGFVITGNERPSDFDFTCNSNSADDLSFVILASLRVAFAGARFDSVRIRLNQEVAESPNSPALSHFNHDLPSKPSTALHSFTPPRSSSSSVDTCHSFRACTHQQSMGERLKRDTPVGKLEISTSTVAASTRDRYRAWWAARHEFCDGMQIPPRFGPIGRRMGRSLVRFLYMGS